jgi:membrane protease YdiL (CAAX protease family)
MSVAATHTASPAPLAERAAAAAVVPAAVALLLARAALPGTPAARPWVLAAGYAAIAAAALVVPPPTTPAARRWTPRAALAVGVVAVAVVAVVTGPPPPVGRTSAALPLALLAAVAEEALFRRAAYDRLSRFGAPVAVAVTAAAFAVIHLPAYGVAAFPVDLGAGLLLSWQRWAGGTWTVPAVTHVVANLAAVLR